MSAKPLLSQQSVTRSGEKPSAELLEIIQRLVDAVAALEARVTALEP